MNEWVCVLNTMERKKRKSFYCFYTTIRKMSWAMNPESFTLKYDIQRVIKLVINSRTTKRSTGTNVV
jgi:hypothetical protein